jgi:hypothetical protein
MMRLKTGPRLVIRASGLAGGQVVMVAAGIEIRMTAIESHELRDRLQAAEIELERMDGELTDEGL